MSSRWFLTVPLLVLTVSACNPFRQEPAVQVSASDPALNTRWHANLASPGSLAGAVQMSGSASMAPGENGSTTITINLANASPGGLHPWAAHWGQCGSGFGGGVLGTNEAYRPLTVGSDGQATATVTVPLETPRTGRYFVVVRASAANYDTIVACGNLAPPTR
jgi:hypothetical protein